jgi:hypothetical protein
VLPNCTGILCRPASSSGKACPTDKLEKNLRKTISRYSRKASLSTRPAPILWLRQRHERRVPAKHRHVVYPNRTSVLVMKPGGDTLKLYSVSGSRVVRLKPQAGRTPTQGWRLRVACMPCVARAEGGTRPAPSYCHQEQERERER